MDQQLSLFDYEGYKQSSHAYLATLSPGDCISHPLNPRMKQNEELITRIAEQIKKHGYKPEHAILVRPLENSKYQIVSGHNRKQAAKEAGVDMIAWVVPDMDDETAHSLLLLENDQSELTALEKGKHAWDHLHTVEKGKGGSGKLGRLSKYAETHNYGSKQVVEQWYKSYEVAKTVNTVDGLVHRVLYEISKTHQETWQALCDCALEKKWTVDDTKDRVKRVKLLYAAIPDWWSLNVLPIVENTIRNKTTAASMVSMFSRAKELAEGLEPTTIYQLKRTEEKVIEDGREYYVCVPVSIQYDSRQQFIDRVTDLPEKPNLNKLKELHKEILEYIRDHSVSSRVLEPVESEGDFAVRRKAEAKLAAMQHRERYTPTLIHSDVLNGLRLLGDETRDLVCIDPPYNLGQEDWDEKRDWEEYAEWAKLWLKECYRLLKPTGSIYLFGTSLMLSRLLPYMEEVGFQYTSWIVWDTIQGAGGGLWVDRHEDILYCTKTDEPYTDTDSVKLFRHEENIREYKGQVYEFKNPSNVWRFPCVDAKDTERTDHPTQKPVELLERIIKASCPPDGHVLDCFMGSGTTGVAAMGNLRRCHGIEKEKAYIDIAEQRFSNTEIQDAPDER